MKVGDLVQCTTANGALAVVIAVEQCISGALIEVVLAHNNALCCFQRQHLVKVNTKK